jgi:hypothetical protein
MPNTSNIIDIMRPFMFTEENLVKYFTNFSSNPINKEKSLKNTDLYKKSVKSTTNSLYVPNETDKLFWCFYIIQYGFTKYEQVFNKFVEEKKIKIELIDIIRKNKDILKKNKWKRNIIENELVNESKISIETFMCLLTIFSYSFAIKKNLLFFEKIIHDDPNKINLIIINQNEIGLYIADNKNQLVMDFQKKLWSIENYKKPLKSINNYKIKDLKDIALKLGLTFEKKKKKEIYALILENLD